MRASCCIVFVLTTTFLVPNCEAQLLKARPGDWPWWRGPSANGVAEEGQEAPVEWSATKNVSWKVNLTGRGHASPTVVGGRIFLATADERAKSQSIVGLNRETGKQLWLRKISDGGFPRRINRKNTHATSTIACDSTRLYAAFLHHDAIHVVALDLSGKVIWKREAGKYTPDEYKNGYAASPVLYGNLVIVACDFDGDAFMAAFDRASGEPAWNVPRPSRINYASPIIAHVSGRDQLLISGGDIVAGYDPATGKQLWKTTATTMATAGTMVWDGDLVFASGGYPDAQTICIRADGSGEHVWKNRQKCYEQSMLAHGGHIYAMNDGGILFCWNAATGDELWRERLRGPISASPVLADGNIYLSNELGTTWVVRATPKQFQLVSKNQLGSESFASPTICGGQVFLRVADKVSGRRQETLYCLETAGGK